MSVVALAAALAESFTSPRPSTTAAPPPAVIHPARLPGDPAVTATWASTNWSGYAETGHLTAVNGSWTAALTPVTAGGGRYGRSRAVSGYDSTITLSDATRHRRFTATQIYDGTGSSAEWIVEEPDVNGATASLPDYRFPAARRARATSLLH